MYVFRVPEVDEFFRSEGSGSGVGGGETDFFLPALHQRASLGPASHILVTIEASDDAHGIFQFSMDSLNVNGTEPEDGYSTVVLQVKRIAGALSRTTIFWEADTNASDLVTKVGNVTFDIGQNEGSIVIQISSDEVPELDKTFVINLINVSNGRLGMLTKSNLTVLASDDPYGIFIFSNNSKSIRVQEGNKTTVLVIQRLKGLMGSVKVGYETVKDNEFSAVIPFSTSRAKEGSDFLPVSGFVTFVANQSEANITLNILDDTEPERAESVFIQLTNVSLIQGVQQRTIVFSPRLGLKIDTISEVIIEASDDAFGILSLSSSTISVAENYVGPIINVTRTGGIFADVSVKFRAFPMTARVGEDYTVASSDVVLLDGETSKPVPIHINNDDNPEIEETFRIELLNQTTGGALLGDLTQAIITIEASDDPYGSFGYFISVFQVVSQTIEEPDVSPTTVNLTIVRNSGTLGNVTVQWAALINGQFAFNDIHPVTGRVSFAPGETIKTLTVQILPDDVPEIEEVIRVELTSASNGGSIGQLRSVNLIVPPNDNPYGTVTFRQLVYRVREPLEGTFSANITVRRSGGFFGQLQILYSTSEVDVVGMALLEGQNILSYYDLPVKAVPAVPVRLQVNVTLQKNDFLACAAFCLRERACQAFSFFNNSGVPRCDWSASLANGMTNTTDFLTYRKNLTMVSALFSSQAIAGSDFESKTGSVAMMLDGQETANLTVSILSDALPEVDEMFTIQLLAVNLLNISSSPKNKPSIGQPDRANITIAMNGDAFGVFLIYSTSPNATERGLYLEVQEQPQTTVYLVIERRGGSLGQVTIEWSVVGGSATPNIDFTGTGEVLTFADGDLKKTIQLTILDDIHPEENETIVVSLTQTEGGSRILPSSDTVTIVILANDNVAGVIGFQTTSRSVIMREGETVQLHVERSFPGSGNVTVNWNIQGPRVQQNFINVSGVLFFSEGTLNATITVNLLDDGIPEEREEYRVVLSNVITKGAAALDKQGFEAVLTVEASDEPYGVLKFAPSSKMIFTREENKTLQLFITREFGSLGAINITYETVKGSLQPLNMTEVSLAEPGLDFLPVSGFIVLQPGQTSAVITVTILEDEVPELAEIFLINITSAVLITYHPSVASPHLDIQGLVSQITIDASDGVRGIIAWKSINFEVNETDTSLTLVAYRNAGTYGNVSLFFNVQSLEAQLGFDFNVTPTVLHFVDGERYKVIEVMIFDDIIPEGDEKFQLILVNPSYGLELGAQTTATVTILANDDGHGVISFNNSDHFLLKEPTSLNLGESTATLYIIRDPPQGTFGMVTVRYLVSGLNGSDASHDLTPTEGFIVLKDGERFQTLQISAILDEEPEMNETFIITLSDPTGGARMGMVLQSFITVLQNQAPLGLFRIFPINRTSPVIIEEGNRTLYLGISRSNGLDTTVTVEWETQPVTAYGFVHVLFAGNNRSAIYSWKLQSNQFEFLLDIPAAKQMHFFNVRHFNSTKALVAAAEDSSFVIYELTYISNQSDFIPSSGELKFEPGNREHVIAVNIIEDNLPEEEESFRVQLKNPKGGAEIGPNGFVTVIIPPNDNAYGVVAFAQNSLTRMVEELEQDNLVTLNVERLRGTFGRITVYWAASGSLSDIRPTSGVITFSEGQVFATLSITILADSLPELSETVTVNLTQVVTLGIQDPLRGALIDAERFKAEITILPSDSPYGVIGWHTDSFFFTTQEPEGNPKNISLKIVREQGFVGDVIIYYKTTPVLSQLTVNQAKDREDYVAKEDTLIMKENVMMTSVQITVLPDSVPELSERFLVNITKVELVNASAGSGQPSVKRVGMETAEVIIEENDDPRGIVQFNVKKDMTGGVAGYELLPPRNLLRLPVIRLAGTFGKIVIDWMATPVSASFEDFTPANGTLVFTDGQDTAVIEITIVDDNIIEFSETFNVSLTRISGGARLGNDSSIMVYIPPNDSPVGLFSFEMKTVTAREPQFNNDPSGMVTLSVMRNEGARGAVQIVWLVEEAAKDDITPLNGTLFFNETDTKKTIPLYIVKDSILEGEERFIIQLVSATNNAEINPVDVSSEFEETSGFITMKNQQSAATIRLKTIDDDIPEEKLYYQLTLTRVSEGAEINESSRSSNITMVASDVPYGRFSFSQEFLETLEEQRLVSVTISRSMGKFGRVQLWYQTTSGTAVGGFDFSPVNGQIIFEKEEVNKTISVEVLNDNIPEGPEEFFLNITRVELLPGSAFDFTIREGGLQLDQPPTIGNISTLTVVIQKNDNAEGIIEFDPKYLIFVVSEDVGMLQIPVFRRQGTFGLVTGEYISKGSTALPNMDYILPNGSVVFYHGQNQSFINVSIIDDADREYDEHFEIQLTAATGGAVLGTNLTTRVTIAKSDSPNGLVRFLNQTQLVIPNPNSTLALTFVLERTGGLAGAAEVTWNILGPNSKDFLLPGNTDIGEPLNGSFSFGDGEGGVRAITLKILPHSDVEVQESFIIKLSLLSGEMDIDAKAGNITLIIQKFGDPNGVVQFALDALMERTFIEPNNSGGPLSISFPVTRVQGTTGNITVFWEIRSNSDMTGDFLSFQGSITILDMQRSGEITIKLLPDDIPEMDELYSVWLTSVDGGAEIDINNSSSRFTVKSNDDPHGLFAIYSPLQSVTVGQDLMRYIVLNVTRLAGTFGNVTVEYKITANTPGGDFFMDKVLGNLIIRDGAKFGTSTVPISNQIFYAVGFNFSIELSNVTLVKGQPDISPRIQAGAKTALVYIPEEAANSEVGFDNIALQIANLSSSICTFMITRKGVYGSVTVEWNSGYPVGQAPLGFPVGQILPSTGILTLGHGERNRTVPLTVILNNTKPEAFAVYIKTLNSSNPGGARLRSGFTIAEVEPLGIFQFAPSYRQLVIEEDDQVVTLYVQKLFGFRSKQTRLTFQTLAGSAKPKEDFVPVEKGELLFEALQYEASIHLSVLNDNISESDEIFYVKLINVTEKNGNLIHTMPRLIQEFSTASITISANDVINGFMSIGPSLVQIAEDSRNGIQQTVVLRVHRSVGFTGAIQVMVKTFGGKSITSGLLESPFGIQLSELNHIWAREGEDFQDQMLTVTFQEGEKEANVSFKILDDSDPEGSEVFYVYLTNPQGGAQILPGIDDKGYTSFAKILILGNDFQNGIVGFTLESQTGLVLDEDSEKRKVLLTVERQTNRVFEDLVVLWQATLNESNALLQNNEVNLTKELLFISGSTTCKKGEVTCTFTLELRQDKTPEFETWFLVELYQVGEGAMINNSARFANITILESDNPRGLIYFAVGSRLPVVHQKTTLISLRVTREPSNSVVSVSYETRELKKEEPVGRGLIWPAIAGMDFENSQGVLTLDVGESTTAFNITLTPDRASSNPLPKRFQVVLSDATGGARVDAEFGIANVTIVSDTETQAVWGLVEQLHQPLETNIINQVMLEGERISLEKTSRGLTYDVLCALANPNRKDTRGLSQLSETAERFAFSLLTDVQCGSEGERGKTILDTCPHLAIKAYHWYPPQINGHQFMGKNGDWIRVPEALLKVSTVSPYEVAENKCEKIQFTEYSSQQWFLTGKPTALNNKRSGQTNSDQKWDSHGDHTLEQKNQPAKPRTNFADKKVRFSLAILSHLFCSKFSMFSAKLLIHMMVACFGTQGCGIRPGPLPDWDTTTLEGLGEGAYPEQYLSQNTR
ncbi:GPR98 protein, partial [Polypterus senegalus]